jgi:AraC-like DNA-binding protein
MVKIAQNRQSRSNLRKTRFANARLDAIGVELMTLSELRGRVPAKLLLETERVEFFMVLVATGGCGEHLIDFVRFPLQAGHVVFVRPGQIQQWQPPGDLEADLLLIDPAVIQPNTTTFQQATMALLRLEEWPNCFKMEAEELASWNLLTPMLRRELDQPQPDALSVAMARELLLCLILHTSRAVARHAPPVTAHTQLLRRFHHELDCLAGTRPSVALLSRRLHVSTSTLTRTCQEVLGYSAKEVLDRRVALEAQRLLVHSTATSSAIGEQLGFTEPTNFVKFFRRMVGATPESFRQARRLPRAPR